MNQGISFQEALEKVESLSTEDQDLLFELIKKRRIEARREEIAKNKQDTLNSLRNGTAKKGNLAQLKADLLAEE